MGEAYDSPRKVVAVIWKEFEDSENGLGDAYMELEDGTQQSMAEVPELHLCSERYFDKFVAEVMIPESHARGYIVPDIKKERIER